MNFLNLGFKNLTGKKKSTIITILIITFSIILILTSYTAYKVINTFIIDNINKNVNCRTVFIKYDPMREKVDNVIKQVKTIPNVLNVFTNEQYSTYVTVDEFKTTKTNGNIRFIAGDKSTIPKILFGTGFDGDSKKNVICPLNIIADDNLSGNKRVTKNDFINGKNFLGKEISVSYFSYDHSTSIPKRDVEYNDTYKVVGLYDAYNDFSDYNVCYISYNEVERINNIIEGNLEQYKEGESFYYPIAIINNSQNIENVSKAMSAFGYDMQRSMGIDIKLSLAIDFAVLFVILLTLVVSTISISVYSKKSIKESEQEIGIMKALGYTNYQVLKTKIIELTIIMITSFVIGIIIYTVLFIISYMILSNGRLALMRFDIQYQIFPIIITLIIMTLVVIFTMSSMIKSIKKSNTIDILRN